MRKFPLAILALMLVFSFGNSGRAQTANAASEKFIFSAVNVTSSLNGGGQFHYSNGNTSVFGRFLDGNFGPSQSVREAGSPLPLYWTFNGESSIRGGYPGMVNDVLYEQLFFSGRFSVSVPVNYVLPYRYNRSKFKVTFPATLTATLRVHTQIVNHSQFPPPIFTTNLNLQGKVVVTLQVSHLVPGPNGTTRAYYKVDVRYEFPPEPPGNFEPESAK
jgi:hypothetical protein